MILQIFACNPTLAAMNPADELNVESQVESLVWSQILLTPLLSAQASCSMWNLLGCSWQAVRNLAFDCVSNYFPCPLPGLSDTTELIQMLDWAWALTQSPRARDSESGAIAMRFIFKKFVSEKCYIIHPEKVDEKSITEFQLAVDSQTAQIEFMNSLSCLLSASIVRMHSTPLSERYCLTQSRLHGSLIVTRLAVEEIPFNSWSAINESAWRAIVQRLVGTIADIASLSMRMHVQSIAFAQIQAILEPIQRRYGRSLFNSTESLQCAPGKQSQFDDAGTEIDDEVDVDCRGHAFVSHGGESSNNQQLLMVISSWLALKEASLLTGALVKAVSFTAALQRADSGRR